MMDYDIVTVAGLIHVDVFDCVTGARKALLRVGKTESPREAGERAARLYERLGAAEGR